MKVLNLRYKIDRQINKDSCGAVYVARDMQQQDKLVTVRVFNSEYSKTEYVQELISKFMFLKSVKHSNLVELYEFDRLTTIDHKMSSKIRYFYTAEYLEETETVDYRTLSVEDAKDAFIELMRVLSYLHFRGIVYQYLNFINTIIYRDQRRIKVKLIDLVEVGLFKDLHTISDYRISLFIPPEVVWSQQFDYSSDIYALGHMLYYLHYRYDYERHSLSDIYDRDSQSDNEINRLIRKMISNYVEDRNYDISHLIDDYTQIHRMGQPFDDQYFYNRIHFGTKLIGREKDFEEVYQAILDKLDKKSAMNGYIVSGENGIGKSRFLREMAYILKMQGKDNISVEIGVEDQREFALFSTILKAIFKQGNVPQDLIHKYGGELTKVVADLSHKYKITPSEVLDGEREQLKLSNRIYNFLIDYSVNNPLLLIIDNMDLANRYDLIVLDYLLRCQKDVPLFIVGSVNKNTLDETRSVGIWEDTHRVRYFQLNKFNYDDANQLIKHILGMNKKPINFTTRVMREAEGNPRRIEEIIQNLYLNKKIYVQNHKNWFISDIESLEELEFTKEVEGSVTINLDALTPVQREVLNIVSIFSDAVEFDILDRMLQNPELLQESLRALVDLNILSEKFGDFGYTYNFNNRHMAEGIVNLMTAPLRKSYHERISILLEDDFKTKQHFVTEALIYHLRHSDQIDKAVEFCFIAADRMKQINIYTQAISFYKRAIELRLQKNQESETPIILLKIAEIHFMLGQQHESEINYEETSKLARLHDKMKEYVDALNGLTQIAISKTELNRAYNYFNEAQRVAIEQGYVEGELKAAYTQCKIYMATNEFESIYAIATKHLEIARAINSPLYEGLFLNELGISLSYKDGSIDEAIELLNRSFRILSEAGYDLESTKALNNLGVLLLDEQANILGARNNFEKIVEYYETYNIVNEKSIMLNNIGETYFIENRYVESLEFFNTAYKLSEETSDDSMSFTLLVNICRNYIDTGDYDKAYLLLKKLEVDYQNDRNRGLDIAYYFFIHVDYFMRTKNLELAEKWLTQYNNADFKMPASIDINLEILSFKLRYYKENYLNSGKSVDINWLKSLTKRVKSGHAMKLIRELILEICTDLIHSRKFILVQELMAIEEYFIRIYDTKALSVHRAVIETAYESHRERLYELIISESKTILVDEQIWTIYKALGDEYFVINNYFMAISNYMMAIDILHKLSHRIPSIYRDSYIMNDEAKLDLKYRINELKRRIIGTKTSEKTYGFSDYEVSSAEEFFNLTDITDLYKNKKFLRTVQQIYFEKYETRFEHINDLISCLQSDELYNIKQMLLYFVQYCFADRGYVIVVDEQGSTLEIIKSDQSLPEPDVASLMKHMAADDDGIVISFIEQNTHSPLLGKNLKGIICMPITKIQGAEIFDFEQDRRRGNAQQIMKDRLGYIYLETDNIFNNFSRESYKQIKTLMNLLFVMIDNYNLKKISTVDKLTGVFLRKYFEDLMNLEVGRAKANAGTFSLVMCDIDKFKSVNDTFGHRKGDEILKKIGAILNSSLRTSDLVGRYGGEEFIILLPNTSDREAMEVCEKMRRHIENQKLLGSDFPLTMSFGVSSFPEHGSSEEELLEKADQALYYSKNNGRNRTTLWDPNIGNEGVRFDKLAGILSGNISKDTRNVQAMVNVITSIRDHQDTSARASELINNLMDITEASQGGIIEFVEGKVTRFFIREKGSSEWLSELNFDQQTLNECKSKEHGEFYINWNDLGDVDLESGIPKWKSMIVIPHRFENNRLAVLVLSVPIADKEFDFADFNFVNSMSGLLTAIL